MFEKSECLNMQISDDFPHPLEMLMNLNFIYLDDVNFSASGLVILLSTYMKFQAPKYLCKSDPFVHRSTQNHSEGQSSES